MKLTYTPEVRQLSKADDTLFKDMLNGIGGVAFSDEVAYPDVKERKIAGIEVLVPYDNREIGVERWTIQHDAAGTAAYNVKFIPDGQGGTSFAVEEEKAPATP